MPEPSHDPTLAWADLGGFIAPEIVRAPKTCGDPQETWPPVHWQSVRYIQGTLVGKPWANHLALVAAVLSARRYDARTVKLVLSRLHTRFKLLFQELALHQMSEWNAEHIFPFYLKGEVLAQDSTLTRERFWIDYCTASKQVWLWLKSLPESQQHQYRPFSLPLVPRLAVHGLLHFKESHQRQQQARKRETKSACASEAQL
jgi:hypothetical protein